MSEPGNETRLKRASKKARKDAPSIWKEAGRAAKAAFGLSLLLGHLGEPTEVMYSVAIAESSSEIGTTIAAITAKALVIWFLIALYKFSHVRDEWHETATLRRKLSKIARRAVTRYVIWSCRYIERKSREKKSKCI